jgi:hypothetical protein
MTSFGKKIRLKYTKVGQAQWLMPVTHRYSGGKDRKIVVLCQSRQKMLA